MTSVNINNNFNNNLSTSNKKIESSPLGSLSKQLQNQQLDLNVYNNNINDNL